MRLYKTAILGLVVFSAVAAGVERNSTEPIFSGFAWQEQKWLETNEVVAVEQKIKISSLGYVLEVGKRIRMETIVVEISKLSFEWRCQPRSLCESNVISASTNFQPWVWKKLPKSVYIGDWPL